MADRRLTSGPIPRVHIQGMEIDTVPDPDCKLVSGPVERVHIQSIDPSVVFGAPAVHGHDAEDVSYDNTTSGLAATQVQAATDELAAAVAAIGQPPVNSTPGTFKVAGGNVVWVDNYEYVVLAGIGYINGIPISWSEQTVTLDPADATNDRIDVFVVNSAGIASAVTGTPAADPSKPDVDPAQYLDLSFAIVYANTTTPTGTSSTLVYAENVGAPAEWATSASAGTVTLGSLTDPRSGTKCIRAVNATSGTTITFTAAAPIDPTTKDLVVLYLKILTAWGNNRSMTVQFYLGTVKKGNAVTIIPGQNGLSNSNLSTYQGQAFLIPTFAFPVGATVDKMVLTVTGGTISFAIDDVALQVFGGMTISTSTGITQAEADARYTRRDQALADLSDQDVRYRTVNIIIDGGGAEIADGVFHGAVRWDFDATLVAWTLLADVSGDVKIDIWKDTYANYPPTDADSICNGHEPEIPASGAKAQDLDLSDWADVSIAAGDIWLLNIDSCTTIAWLTLCLKVLI